MSIYTGDPARLQSSANSTTQCLNELENQLTALSNVQDDLHQAVVSAGTGAAIYNTLGDAWQKGKALAGTLGDIVTQLSQTGVRVDAQDIENASHVNSSVGGWSTSAAAGINLDRV
ncbi:hypothetical protein [Nocardia sp. NBC_00511]|uniref:hypothetical protein n=1 Tax=Nocardia sp. NBC_00511 TaxID=2903591 RepID=UPI002F906F4D